MAKKLLDEGADVNATDSFYHGTALGRAVYPPMGRKPQHAEIVGLLLKHGARGKDFALQAAASAPDAVMLKIVLRGHVSQRLRRRDSVHRDERAARWPRHSWAAAHTGRSR